MSEERWMRDPRWIVAEFDDNLVMLDVDSGSYFGMNRTATAIWNLLTEPKSISGISAELRERFDVSAERCDAAVAAVLARLEEIGAVGRAQRTSSQTACSGRPEIHHSR